MLKIKFSEYFLVHQHTAEDVGVVPSGTSDAAETPAAAAAAVAADAAKDPAVAPAPAEAESEDESEDFALLGSLISNPTTLNY